MKYIYMLDTCQELLGGDGSDLLKIIKSIFTGVRIVAPILAVVLIAKDLIVASAAGKDDDMKKAQSNMIKRLIVLVVIMLLPTIVGTILALINLASGNSFNMCGIY